MATDISVTRTTEKTAQEQIKEAEQTWASFVNARRETEVDLQRIFSRTVVKFNEELDTLKSNTRLPSLIEAAYTLIDQPFLANHTTLPNKAELNVHQVTLNTTRLMHRIKHHLVGAGLRDVAVAAVQIMLDALLLGMGLRTPGLSGLWVEAKLLELFRQMADAGLEEESPLAQKLAQLWSRLHADLVGIEMSLLLTTSEHTRGHIVHKAWKKLAEEGELSVPEHLLPAMEPSFIAEIIQRQGRLCAISCRDLLLYDTEQLLKKGGKGFNRTPGTTISVQQVISRGDLDLGDGAPPFPSFDCLWSVGRYPFSVEVTAAAGRYVQLIHTTERKLTGKSLSGSSRHEAPVHQPVASSRRPISVTRLTRTAVAPTPSPPPFRGGRSRRIFRLGSFAQFYATLSPMPCATA